MVTLKEVAQFFEKTRGVLGRNLRPNQSMRRVGTNHRSLATPEVP